MPPICRPFGALARAAALLLPVVAGTSGHAQTTPQIRNTATITYSTPSGPRSIASNTVSLDLAKRPTSISFREMAADYRFPGVACNAQTGQLTPGTVTPEDLAKTSPLRTLDVRDPVIIVLTVDGGNRDPMTSETAMITVTIGSLALPIALRETGPNTGVFAGGFPGANSTPGFEACDLPLADLTSFSAAFAGDDDSEAAFTSILIDPEGYVFDSTTGATVDGAAVTLIDDVTGQPAMVYGDDGVSVYPSTVISGGSATDSSGEIYQFLPGNYRFPLAPPGTYHFQIMPPARYTAPSAVSPADLAKLNSPPRSSGYIIRDASYGKSYVLSNATPLMVDIPLDPQGDAKAANATLVLEKTASVRDASPGDFVQYRLQLSNTGAGATANAARITDVLPQGLRYRAGSVRGAGEPGVSGDGRTLSFDIARIAAGGSATLTYVASVGSGTPTGEAVNSARAVAANATSNEATASVRIRPLLMTDGFTLTGRVTEGGCNDPSRGRTGVAGIRLVLEDGTYVTTDKDGLYHVEGVRPGTHVVQIDTASVPATLTPVACDRDTRSAGSGVSRFVEASGGTLARVDFQLQRTGKADAAATGLSITAADDAPPRAIAPTGWSRRRPASAGCSPLPITTRACPPCAW